MGGALSREERIEALFSQYGDMERAVQLADEQIAYEGGTPSPLAGQGVGQPDLIAEYYRQNPDAAPGARLGSAEEGAGGRYDPNLGAVIAPAPGIATTNPGQGQDNPSDGYLRAMLQERLKQREMESMGLPGTFGQNSSTMTTPFNDEIAGAVGYLSQGAGNIGRRLTGRPIEVSAADRGGAMMDLMQEYQGNYQRDRPLQSGVAQVVGGFAMAPARAAGAVGAAQNFLRTSNAFARPTVQQGLGMGAGTGAVYGAADTNGGLANRAIGAGVGAGAGLALTGLAAGGEQAVRGLLRGADDRLGAAVQRTLRADQIDPADFASRLDSLPPGGLPMDVAGPNFQGVVEAAAQMPGPARTQIQTAIQTRQAGRADRLGERVSEGLGGRGDYIATLDNLITQRRQAANSVMNEIGQQPVRLDDASVRALRSPLARGEIQRAAQAALASPDQATYEMGANLNRLADTLLDNPAGAQIDVRTAQDLSRALLDMSSEAWRRGDGQMGTALRQIGGSVRQNARQSVPGYDQWLRRYGDESEQIGALELGRQVFRNADDAAVDGMSAEALRTRLADMSETSQEMFRKGVGEAIIARARASGGDLGAMRNILRSREIADRVRLAFPDEASMNRFFQSLDQEVNAAGLDNQVLGNSRTAFRGAAQKQFGAEPPPESAINMLGAGIPGVALEGLRQSARLIGRTVARNRSLLENPASNARLGQALTDPDVLRALLTTQRPRGLFGSRLGAPVGTLPQTAF